MQRRGLTFTFVAVIAALAVTCAVQVGKVRSLSVKLQTATDELRDIRLKDAADAKLDAQTETLVNHLVRQAEGFSVKLARANQGRAVPRDAVSMVRQLGRSLDDDLGVLIQHLLDSDEWIEISNQRHPDHPQHDLKELLQQMCGDCLRERAEREADLAKK